MTVPLPLCTLSFDRTPASNAYTKPIVLLTDELTTSTGDIFAAEFQDAKRAPVFGWRTAGGGGSLAQFPVGFYSDGIMIVTQVVTYRPSAIATIEFPTIDVIENLGAGRREPVDFN